MISRNNVEIESAMRLGLAVPEGKAVRLLNNETNHYLIVENRPLGNRLILDRDANLFKGRVDCIFKSSMLGNRDTDMKLAKSSQNCLPIHLPNLLRNRREIHEAVGIFAR